MFPPLVLAVLGHHDPFRYRRALRSAKEAAKNNDNVRVMAVVDVGTVSRTSPLLDVAKEEKIEDIRTVVGGTAADGKNGVLRSVAKNEWVWQLDGDDVLYPWAVRSIRRDMKFAGNADAIVYYSFDLLAPEQKVWDGNATAITRWTYGRTKDPNWDSKEYLTMVGPKLLGPNATKLRFDRDLLVYEDALLAYQLLGLHQKGKLKVWLSFCTDVWAMEQLVHSSVQDIHGRSGDGYEHWTRILKKKRTKYVDAEASSFGELPSIYPENIASHKEKLKFLNTLEV